MFGLFRKSYLHKTLKEFDKVHNAKRPHQPFAEDDVTFKRLVVRSMFCDLCPTLNTDANIYKLQLEWILHKEGISVAQWDTRYDNESRTKLFMEANEAIAKTFGEIKQNGELKTIAQELGLDTSRL